MKFLILNGTLKSANQSNTNMVCEMAKMAFEKFDQECEIVNLNELDYECSTEDLNDDFRDVIKKMMSVDGVIFATPIWWGGHSSYTQSILERMDPIYNYARDNKFNPFYNKVFGSLISGGGDGFQHIHGRLYSFAANLGFTIPPNCNIESKAQGREEILGDKDTVTQILNCTRNMIVWAEALKETNVTLQARHSTVDINEMRKCIK
jgi:multimeric flavodoxin WrbA